MGGPNPMNILEQSFQEDIPTDTPVSDDFKETLEGNEIIQDDGIMKELSCAICQEPFIKGEAVIKLPCEGQEHYFHRGDDPEKCAGIMPWLEVNNKCPICRTEFPEKENIKKEEDDANNDEANNADANNDEANNDVENNDEENNDEEEQQVPHGFVINIPMGINSDNIGEQVQPLLDEMMDNIFEQKYEEDLQKILMQSFEDS
tara:strand:+ start:417 stop:1025 length:609 start_codon:yes stop_codon:yes gene_type:complete